MEQVLERARAELFDRTLDADGHEMAPSHTWGEVFGPNAGRIGELAEGMITKLGGNNFYNPDRKADDLEISYDTVWNVRGTDAPSAFDFSRRLEVMDKMGIRRQLIFPSFALVASFFATGDERHHRRLLQAPLPEDEIRALGRSGIDEYNAWVIRTTKLSPERLRAVGYIIDNGTVEDLMGQAARLLEAGAFAINIPTGSPPGGVSPADPQLDPFWKMFEDRNAPVLLHIGDEAKFLRSSVWGIAPAFAPGKVESLEIGLEPYSISTQHYAACNFLTVMTLGGVFERFPRLRFGVIETGCSWLGPLAENLDMWARDVHATRLKPFISMLPSQYLARNVRVTPFNNFERVEEQIRRYPYLVDCYCYSTDYPHIEGGKDIKEVFAKKLAPLGYEVMEKFFVTNAEWILPEATGPM